MPMQTVLFDINETVLDLSALKPKFVTYFSNESHMSTWFSILLYSSTVSLVTDTTSDFKSLALAALKTLAGRLNKNLTDEGYHDILGTFANLQWRLEPSAVKVARWVLRETALGNKCRPPDKDELALVPSNVSGDSQIISVNINFWRSKHLLYLVIVLMLA
ncbi:hypothetical protein [uncultured Vibrio sp.]|uniref:hypothetical protein n=1 Tax=uncultured Vibrio sp. TaxID=114054 RepID=UPI0026330667|nr:hypothetical protein [uncultured Vibrio sp.]